MTIQRKFLSPALWLLIALFAAEFFLFDHFGSRRHTAVYPRWNDQVQYLGEAYTGYEYARAHGFARGLWQTLVNPSAQGTLHDFFAVIAFSLAGPSRSAALALNLLALVAWQAALFVAVARRRGSYALAVAMLPLALRGPWDNLPGSAYDFRLDHLAMCALGVTGAVALAVDGFRSRRWSLAFGAAVGLTLLTRFLTGTYFVLIFGSFLAWTLSGADRRLRTTNLALAAVVAFGLAAPFFWLNREWVWNYYWIGHYVGPESAIRNPHMGFGRSLAFVWGNLAQRHLGLCFGILALGGGAALALICRGRSRRAEPRQAWVPGAVFLLAPALVLTLHQQKSEVVVSALVPGAILLVVALWLCAARRTGSESAEPTGGAIAALPVFAGVVAIAALAFFTQRQLAPAYDPVTLADLRQVNRLADYVFNHARAAKLAKPRVAVDHITDCLDGQVLRVVCYERHHVWVPFDMTLPISIAEPPEAQVMERLERSDFVFLTEEAPAGGFPFDQKLAAMRPQLRAWCDAHLRVVERFSLIGRRMVLYQRPGIPLP